jgi:UDP-glucose 4-epimerase
MAVLVTGGAGYIGSHVANELLDAGHDVVVVDNLSMGARERVPPKATFVEADIGQLDVMCNLLRTHPIEAVMHFAASVEVPESVTDPLKYYRNNTAASRSLIEACVACEIYRFVFSSTAAVYGTPERVPVTEAAPTLPISPYGHSKRMTEIILRDVAAATPLRYVALRYFNVAGADPQGRTGQSTPNATHLIKVACQAALGRREAIDIYGTDYDTPDGTCIRDYIHVTDLADVHLKALDHLDEDGTSLVLNCGYGQGFSVREVLAVLAEIASPFSIRETGRRAGDSPALVADTSRLQEIFQWTPRHDDLREIIQSALDWETGLS